MDRKRDGFIDLRPCQHDNGYMEDRSQIKVHTDERTNVHSAQSFLAMVMVIILIFVASEVSMMTNNFYFTRMLRF